MEIFYKMFWKNRIVKTYRWIFLLCFLLCLFLVDVSSRLEYTIHQKENRIENRELLITSSKSLPEIKKEISSIHHIEKVEKGYPLLTLPYQFMTITITNLNHAEDLNIIKGRNLDPSKMEMIVPATLEVYQKFYGTTIKFENFASEISVVGVYDDGMDESNIAYVGDEIIHELSEYFFQKSSIKILSKNQVNFRIFSKPFEIIILQH